MTRREIKSLALSFRKGILGDRQPDMMCMAVCYPLQGYLAMLGVKTEIVEADFGRVDHVWLELESGEILDPTADQFSSDFMKFPKVYLGPVPEVYRSWMEGAKP